MKSYEGLYWDTMENSEKLWSSMLRCKDLQESFPEILLLSLLVI